MQYVKIGESPEDSNTSKRFRHQSLQVKIRVTYFFSGYGKKEKGHTFSSEQVFYTEDSYGLFCISTGHIRSNQPFL